ncbi:MAG: c-type cytochrome [Actinomycetota bacterium]
MKRLGVVVPVLLVLGACGFFGTHTKRYEPGGVQSYAQPSTGPDLYQRNCAWCHGNRGEGTPRGPDLVTGRNGPALTDFMLGTGRMPIVDPHDKVLRGTPSFSREDVAKIVAYVSTLGGKGPPIPMVDPSIGDLALGESLYQANCAACHSVAGIGGALAPGQPKNIGSTRIDYQAPSLRRSNATQIAEAMETGPGTMPVFSTDTFSDKELDSIVRYVLYLQHPQNRGGADIGRIGPVAEGAVAWVIGLGAIVLVARWIGTTVSEGEEEAQEP